MGLSLRQCSRVLSIGVLATVPLALHAVTVHGIVTDSLGDVVPNAVVALVHNGRVIVTVKSNADGAYELISPESGRFFVLVAAKSFRQIQTQSFYGGKLDAVERNVALEPASVRESVVVTATGTPTPEAQVSGSVTALGPVNYQNRAAIVDALRQVPGVNVVQTGELGSETSIFIRGGNSTANRITLDGVPIEDIGGDFDLSSIATTGIANIEVYRDPDSTLYGSDAAAGVVALTTPQGSTSFPSLLYEGDAGDHTLYRNQVQLGGMRQNLDYYGAFSQLQTQNSIAASEYHNLTSAANVGYNLSSRTTVRVTVHNANLATDVPGTYEFFGQSNVAKQSDQDTYGTGTIEHTFRENWHGFVRYGLVRNREEYQQIAPSGELLNGDYANAGNYFGNTVTIRGANGYSVTGRALMNYSVADGSVYPDYEYFDSNRDNLYAQSDYTFNPHLVFTGGFRFEDERGMQYLQAYSPSQSLERANYDYDGQFSGEAKNRLFYSASGSVEKNQLYGTVGSPRASVSYYLVRPGEGKFKGTKLNFNFSKGYQEPTLYQQFESLYSFLEQNGGQAAIQQYGIAPIGAETSRSYDGGIEQSLFSQRVTLRATYFHNEFGNQIEAVPAQVAPTLLPQLTAAQQQQLTAELAAAYYSPDLNSQSYRAQGGEAELEWGIKSNIYLRAGYTYLDAVVQRSFSSDAVAASSGAPNTNPLFPNVPIGFSSPLVGARPFRRPPHTGYTTVTYAGKKLTGVLTGSFASRSDDSTFLIYSDVNGGNTLLLPNRDLDWGYAKVDLGLTYQLQSHMALYTQLDNMLSQQHIAPVGYTSLPFNFRTGVRITFGHLPKD